MYGFMYQLLLLYVIKTRSIENLIKSYILIDETIKRLNDKTLITSFNHLVI